MPDNFGISFMPTDEGQQQQGAPPLQEAIKLLNLRLPRVLGAQAPVNRQLLEGTGLQGGSDFGFLRQLLGAFMPQTQGPPTGGAGVTGPTTRPTSPEGPGGQFPGGIIRPFQPQPTPRPRPDRGLDFDPSAPQRPTPRFTIGPRPPGEDQFTY